MRVAVVGGTGPFGRALAARSTVPTSTCRRLAGRGARADDGSELDCVGETNPTRAPRRTSSSSRSTQKARSTRPRAPRHDRIHAASLGRLGAPIHQGRRPPVARGHLARRADPGRARRAPCRRAPLARRASLGADHPPDEDAFVCGDDPKRRPRPRARGRLTSGRALDAGPLASARALEGLHSRHREPEPPVQGPRGDPGHRAG